MENEKELELEQTQAPETQDVPEETQVEETPVEEAAAVEEAAPVEPAPAPVEEKPKKVKKIRHRPWPLKLLLGLVAFALCIVMFVVTIAGALVIDLRVMSSEGGINQLLSAMFMPNKPAASNRLSVGMTLTAVSPVPGTGTDETADMSNFLLDAAFDILQQQFGEDIPITKEQVGNFLEESTAKDFLSEKVSGVIDDMINNTSNTTITRDEIMGLVKDNKQLIEETFEVTIEDSMLEEMEQALEEVEIFDQLEEKGFADVVIESVVGGGNEDAAGAVEEMQEAIAAFKQTMAIVGTITSDSTLFAAIGAFVVLFLLVFLVNFSLPKTLSDTGIVLTFAGLILSAPNFLFNSGVLYTLLPAEMSGVLSVAGGLLAAIQMVHFAILGTGVALIVLAIVAKILKNNRQKKLLAQCA